MSMSSTGDSRYTNPVRLAVATREVTSQPVNASAGPSNYTETETLLRAKKRNDEIRRKGDKWADKLMEETVDRETFKRAVSGAVVGRACTDCSPEYRGPDGDTAAIHPPFAIRADHPRTAPQFPLLLPPVRSASGRPVQAGQAVPHIHNQSFHHRGGGEQGRRVLLQGVCCPEPLGVRQARRGWISAGKGQGLDDRAGGRSGSPITRRLGIPASD